MAKHRQPQWCKAYFAILRDPKLSTGARLTLILLRSYCRFGQDTCWPSQQSLCRDLGCSAHSIIRYLDELERKHCIRRKHRRRADRAFTSTLYTVLDERKAITSEAFPMCQKRHTASIDEEQEGKYTTAKALRFKIVK